MAATEGAHGGDKSEYIGGKTFTKGRIGLSSARLFTEVLRGEDSHEDSLDPLGWVGSIVNGELTTDLCLFVFTGDLLKEGKDMGTLSSCHRIHTMLTTPHDS